MVPVIIAVAETAQDIAAALDQFLGPVDDQSAEITALMAECLSTSSALRHLDRTIGPFPHHRRYPLISRDLSTVKDSLTYTFDDVKRLFGRLGRVAQVPGAEYGDVWDDLCDHFRLESGNSLRRRMEIYCFALQDLTDTLTQGSPGNLARFDELMAKLESLLDEQHDRSLRAIEGLHVRDQIISRPNSFERRRPRDVPPRERSRPDLRGDARGGRRPSDIEADFVRGRPPPVPDAPGSPTTSHTFSSQSSTLESVLSSHWVPEVFNQSRPSTLLEDGGQTSVCFAESMPGCGARLDERGYVRLLELSLENGDLIVRLYQRPHDGRSRFLCRTIRPARSRKEVVLPLTSLEVLRSGSFLKFVNMAAEDRPQLWACFKFHSFELMALFFCTFIALRCEDTNAPTARIDDHHIHRETELFAGRIVDDHYEHALRLFRERESGVVRLQASAQSGEFKRKPIWTAFITHQILSPTWMSQSSSRVIHLAELQRYVFTEEYNPQMTSNGAHELAFIESRGM